MNDDDPLRMYLVVRRGALSSVARGGELAGAAAVRCVREFADNPGMAEWRPRPGKVTLRARGGQWDRVLNEPHSTGGDGVIALPPRRRSERGELLEQMQAMMSELEPPPDEESGPGFVYMVNPELEMSSGKTLAQVAHAAVLAGDGGNHEGWVEQGCPAQVIVPPRARFRDLCARDDLAAKVVDAGLTEVPPGTVTVVALVSP